MGKKSGRKSSSTDADAPKATAFVLKVPMHCRCDGCGDKIRGAVKDLALRCGEGILSLHASALDTKGELAMVATAAADPERLRRRMRRATGKSVDLVFPKPAKPAAPEVKDPAAAAALQALLAGLQLQQQQQLPAVHGPHHGHPIHAGAWNALQQQHHGGYGHAAAYHPWVVQQQQLAAPEPYYATAYPAASWGAYAAPYPHDVGLGGAYGGGGGSGTDRTAGGAEQITVTAADHWSF